MYGKGRQVLLSHRLRSSSPPALILGFICLIASTNGSVDNFPLSISAFEVNDLLMISTKVTSFESADSPRSAAAQAQESTMPRYVCI